jgi:hypothetical protein
MGLGWQLMHPRIALVEGVSMRLPIYAWPLTRESVKCQLDGSSAALKHANWGREPSRFRTAYEGKRKFV